MIDDAPSAPAGEFMMFASADGKVRIECRFEGDTLWLPQAAMAELYQVTPQTITQHIRTVYEEGELEPNRTCKDYLQVQTEGSRQVHHYSRPLSLAVYNDLKRSRFCEGIAESLQTPKSDKYFNT